MTEPSFQTEDTRSFPSLRGASEMPFVTEDVTIANGETVTKGTVLGHVTGGDWVPVDDTLANGAEEARAVAAEDIDASQGATDGVAYRTGVFAEKELNFGGDDVVADHRDAMAAKGIFVRSTTA